MDGSTGRHFVWECWYCWIVHIPYSTTKGTPETHRHTMWHLFITQIPSLKRGASSWRQLKVTISHWTIKNEKKKKKNFIRLRTLKLPLIAIIRAHHRADMKCRNVQMKKKRRRRKKKHDRERKLRFFFSFGFGRHEVIQSSARHWMNTWGKEVVHCYWVTSYIQQQRERERERMSGTFALLRSRRRSEERRRGTEKTHWKTPGRPSLDSRMQITHNAECRVDITNDKIFSLIKFFFFLLLLLLFSFPFVSFSFVVSFCAVYLNTCNS